MIGIDLGLDTLAMRSDSTAVANLRIGRRAQRKLRIRQRALRRCKKGSMRRRKIRRGFTRLHAKIGNARQTYLHQQSAKLVKEYDLIAIEALNVKGLARGDLARSVHDVAWGTFIAMLRYKAARDGAQLIEVDPAYTSQTCPECGAVAKKPLEQRWHSCPCGCELDRDVAAARVILNKAVVGLGWPKVTQWGELATGNLAANGKTLPPALSPLLKPESDSVTPP